MKPDTTWRTTLWAVNAVTMLRLFVALRPPASMRERLVGMMHGMAGARWQSDAQLHLTLAFIGDVDGDRAARIDAALGIIDAPALSLGVEGVGTFADGHGRGSLWAAATPAEALAALALKVERALIRAHAPLEKRTFIPHITLARMNRSSGASDSWLAANATVSIAPSPIGHFGLYESRLGKGGSAYHLLADYPLR